MTLAEIKTKVPELQKKIADLAKIKQEYSKILAEIEAFDSESKSQKDMIKSCDDFISKNGSDPKKKNAVDLKKRLKQDLEKDLQLRKSERQELEKRKSEFEKKHPNYSKIEDSVKKIQTELDSICDVLVQDPRINYQMQTAVMVKFDEEIGKQNAQKAKYQKTSKDIGEALKDDSSKGLKSIMEEVKKGKEEFDASLEDSSINSNDARKKYKAAKTKLVNEIKSRFGIDVKPKDIDYMITAITSNQLDDFTLPSLASAIKDIDSTVSKLEETKSKTLESIEAKRVDPTVEQTTEMKENQENIDRISQEVTTLDTEISDMQAQMTDLDKQIKDKEDEIGEPSDEYKEFKEAEKNLKEKHIIAKDAIPELSNPDSEVSKKYKEFETADLEVRKAFQACKVMEKDADRTKSIDDLKKAIEKYQKISEELSTLTGYDTESWHNYLLADLNDRVLNKETLDSAYYHTDNQNFKDILDDKEAMNGGKAVDEYEAVEDSLKLIDDSQEKILKGDFSVEADKLFAEPDKGYFKLMDDFQNASGLEKGGKDKVTVFDLIKDSKMILRKPFSKIRGFFKRISSKFKPKEPFDIPEENQDAIDKYNAAKTSSVKEEIEKRKGLDELISKREELRKAIEAKTTTSTDKKAELTQAKEKQAELERAAAAKKPEIEGTEMDFRRVKYDDTIIQAAVDRVEHDDDRDL